MEKQEESKKRIRIDECKFSLRSLNIIISMDLIYLDELAEKTARELCEYRGLGSFTLKEIRHVLSAYDMSLKGDFLPKSNRDFDLVKDIPGTIKEIRSHFRSLEYKIRQVLEKLDQIK